MGVGVVEFRPAGGRGRARVAVNDNFASVGLLGRRDAPLDNVDSLAADLDGLDWGAPGEDDGVVAADDDDEGETDGEDDGRDRAPSVDAPLVKVPKSFDDIARALGVRVTGDRVYIDSGEVMIGKLQFIHGTSMSMKAICHEHSRTGAQCYLLVHAMDDVDAKYERLLQWLVEGMRGTKPAHLRAASEVKSRFYGASRAARPAQA